MSRAAALRVFINYRRDDTAGHAGRLHDSIMANVPEADVFMDVGDIEPGVDFTVAITNAIGSCDVMLALIGPRWATATDADGGRRIDDPDDHVVMEIASAMEHGLRVIPTLIDGAVMPEADALPPRIAEFSRRNAVQLATVTWPSDLETLLDALRRMLPQPAGAPAPAAPGAALAPVAGTRRASGRSVPRWAPLAAAAAVVLVAVVAIAVASRDDGGGPTTGGSVKQLAIQPDVGPAGTTIRLSGEPCERPRGWSSGEVYFGLHDPRTQTEPIKGELSFQPGASLRAQLTVPANASAGEYSVYANCWGQSPDGEWREFDFYEATTFTVG